MYVIVQTQLFITRKKPTVNAFSKNYQIQFFFLIHREKIGTCMVTKINVKY